MTVDLSFYSPITLAHLCYCFPYVFLRIGLEVFRCTSYDHFVTLAVGYPYFSSSFWLAYTFFYSFYMLLFILLPIFLLPIPDSGVFEGYLVL